MTYDRSDTERRLDDIETTLDDMPREIEERLKPYFRDLEVSHKEDMENLESHLEVSLEDLSAKLVRRRRNS